MLQPVFPLPHLDHADIAREIVSQDHEFGFSIKPMAMKQESPPQELLKLKTPKVEVTAEPLESSINRMRVSSVARKRKAERTHSRQKRPKLREVRATQQAAKPVQCSLTPYNFMYIDTVPPTQTERHRLPKK
jgi:hypothetical protein